MKSDYGYTGERVTDLKQLYRSAAVHRGQDIFIREKHGGARFSYPFQKFARDVDALGTALCTRGLCGKRILLTGENGYAWALAYMAVACNAGVVLPIGNDRRGADLAELASTSNAAAILYSPAHKALPEEIAPALTRISFAEFPTLISFGNRRIVNGDRTYLDAAIAPDTLCTEETPHGRALSHSDLCSDLTEISRMLSIASADTFLSFLPLHRVYACICSLLLPLYHGASVTFYNSGTSLTSSMRESEPTVLVGAPPLAERIYAYVLSAIAQRGLSKKAAHIIKATDSIRGQGLRDAVRRQAFADLNAPFCGKLRLVLSEGTVTSPRVLAGLRDFGIRVYQRDTATTDAEVRNGQLPIKENSR